MNKKVRRRLLKVLYILLITIVALVISSYFAIKLPFVQDYLIGRIEKRLSDELETNVTIENVSFDYLSRIILSDILIEDQQGDTLIYVKYAKTKLQDYKISTSNLNLTNISLESPRIKVVELDSNIYNYNFILSKFQPKRKKQTQTKSSTSKKIDSIQIHLNNISISNGNFSLKNNQQGLFEVEKLNLNINEIHVEKKLLNIDVQKFNFKTNKNIDLNKFSAKINASKKKLSIDDISLNINKSVFKLKKAEYFYNGIKNIFKPSNKLNLSISKSSRIDIKDLEHVFDSLKVKKSDFFYFHGDFQGTLNEIYSKNFKLNNTRNSSTDINFYIKNLANSDEFSYMVNLKNLETDKEDYSYFFNNIGFEVEKNQYTKNINNLKLSCSINGSKNQHYFILTSETNLGNINLDGQILNNDSTNSQNIFINLNNTNLNLGAILENKKIGNINFSSSSILNIKNDSLVQTSIASIINKIEYNGRSYRKINFDVNHKNEIFRANLIAKDTNLSTSLLARYSFKDHVQKIKINGICKNILLGKDSTKQQYKFKIDSDFKIDSLYNFIGYIKIKDLKIDFDSNQYNLPIFNVYTRNNKNFKNIFIESNNFSGTINGKFNFLHIQDITKTVISKYSPYKYESRFESLDENFKFKFKLKNGDILNKIVDNIDISKNTSISGYLNAKTKKINLNLKCKKFEYNNNRFDNINLSIYSKNNYLNLSTNSDYAKINDKDEFKNIKLNFKSNNKDSKLKLYFSNLENKKTELNANIKSKDKTHIIDIDNSYFHFGDNTWKIFPTNLKIVNEKEITINNLKITNGQEELYANGEISENPNEKLDIGIKNLDIDVADAPSYFKTTIDGDFELYDLYSEIKINSSIKFVNTNYNNENFGDIYIRTFWDEANKKFIGRLINSKSEAKLNLNIEADKKLNYKAVGRIENIPINIFSEYMDAIDIDGTTKGDVVLTGNLDRPLLNADLIVNDATVDVDYTGVKYKVKDNSVITFKDMNFVFNNVVSYDDKGNEIVTKGKIDHTNFSGVDLILSFKPENAHVIDIDKKEKKGYYGKAYGSGEVILKVNDKISVQTSVETLKGSKIYIPLSTTRSAKKDIVKFKKKETEIAEVVAEEEESDIELDLNFFIDPNTELLLESGGQKMLETRGNGNINIKTNSLGDVLFYGDYKTQSGKYIFNLLNIPIKEFELIPGGTIDFKGDIAESLANIKAVYKLPRVSTTSLGIGISKDIPVDCYLVLDGRVTESNIKFMIDIPENSADAELIKNKLNDLPQIKMNTQIFYLLLMRKFSPLIQNEQLAENDVSVTNSLFEVLGNQLNVILSKVTDNINIGLSYKEGDKITSDQLQLALSYYFNDKIKLQVQSDVNVNSNDENEVANRNNNDNLLKEAEIEITPIDNSNLKIKAFHKYQNEFELNPNVDNNYKQGVGISYEEDFDSFSDLFSKYFGFLIGSKEEKKEKYSIIDSTLFNDSDSLKIDSTVVSPINSLKK
jgi:hypothetical protein